MEFNTLNNFPENGPAKISVREKIIIAVLAVLFVAVLSGALWDLYGRKMLCNCNCSTQNAAANNTGSTNNNTALTNNATGASVPATEGQTAPNNQPADKKPGGQAASANQASQPKPADSNVAYASYSTCVENTKDLPASKDCCDCLPGDASVHKACRDFAATYDFSKNTVFKTFEIPSTLGQNGDYSSCTASGNQQQCKQCCENTGKFVCGDFRFCRTACDGLSQ